MSFEMRIQTVFFQMEKKVCDYSSEYQGEH